MSPAKRTARSLKVLARREEIRRLVAMGLTNDELVKRLGVSNTTVTNDLTAMGITRREGYRTNGKSVINPVQALSRVLSQMADLTEQLDDIIGQMRAYDYRPDLELLEAWEATLTARDNPSAVIQRLRRYISYEKEQRYREQAAQDPQPVT